MGRAVLPLVSIGCGGSELAALEARNDIDMSFPAEDDRVSRDRKRKQNEMGSRAALTVPTGAHIIETWMEGESTRAVTSNE